jgi:hypothetical protein
MKHLPRLTKNQPARRQKPTNGMYRYRSATGVKAISVRAANNEGKSVSRIQNNENP